MGEVIKVIFCRFPHVSQKDIGKINGRGTALHKKCTYLTKPNHMSVAYYLKNKSISNVLIVVGHSKPTTARGGGKENAHKKLSSMSRSVIFPVLQPQFGNYLPRVSNRGQQWCAEMDRYGKK